ncbi:MAG: EAL domain-containing protein [Cyanobacteria bacterium J06643_4]
MTAAPLSAKETLRLAKLRDYGVLDTLPDETYDDITVLAAQICQTPTALVSLVDASRQWFKSKVGLDVDETPRSIAFCAYTIEQSEVFIVEDTQKDPTFANNPLVTGPPYIRFYAGAPLVTPDGHALGSLCVLDYKPRKITAAQRNALAVLSRQVMAQLELSHQRHLLLTLNEQLEQRVQERTAGLTTSLHRLIKTQATLLKREAASRHNALHDPLTGLPNRSYFLQRLDEAIQLTHRQPNRHYAVLFIDLNNFKPVNDSLGHEVGDRLLAHVASQIQQQLRKSDLVARLGGDEFAVLLDNVPDEAQAIIAIKRLQAKLETPFEIGHHRLAVGASIGVTFSSVGYRDPAAALRDADLAMYQAKKQTKERNQAQLTAQLDLQKQQQSKGKKLPIVIQDDLPSLRQTFVIFDAEMQGRAQARLTLEDELRQAIQKQQLFLHFQPIFDLGTQQLTGFEGLLRWYHPTKGCLAAIDFIDVAEELGITCQLSGYLIRVACEQVSKWRSHFSQSFSKLPPTQEPEASTASGFAVNAAGQSAQRLSIHINLSMMQIRYPQIVLQWQAALKKYQVPASAFQLEIAEQSLLSGDPMVTDSLHKLKSLGFCLCVDDFGKGHSSLSRLHQLEVNTIKIDRSFVRELGCTDGLELVKTMIDFGHSANLDVVAEGIETQAQMQALLELGCQYGQGVWLADAMPIEEINDTLMRQRSDFT